MNLLIVDDRPFNLELLRAELGSAGHTVVEASDGVEALGMLALHAVDAVVSDALMPNMDGFQLCRRLRGDVRHAKLPFVIYTSTYDSPKDRQFAIDSGVDQYVLKPAPVAQLLAAVGRAQALAARRTAPAAGQAEPEELGAIKQYNAALIAKLENKNTELEKANRDLQASEARFHGTLDRMLEGCQILDAQWRYLYLNNAAAAHGRREKRELLGRTILECYPGFERSEVFGVLARCMQQREGARVENEFNYPDGTTAWFELSIQPVPEGLFILSLDITERKFAARKIGDQVEELLRWQEVMLDREDRIGALKAEVNQLLAESLRPARYAGGGSL